ncbi:MAG: UDP-N-acetylglucosamine 1-carboxyvinyltransferase [Candidatus Coatesbacteria bacterium]|nr:MAG: UDP-N-acetylglucosamine 1-carboxyvinyltransferase [Candidatus Coatesbacteria bacterium]
MDKYVIKGGRALSGTVRAQGSKNAVLPMIPAALLVDGTTVFRGVPGITDIHTISAVMESLGAGVGFVDGTLSIDSTSVDNQTAPYDLVRRMRASICVLGPLLARYGYAKVSLPGGCSFGPRPVDLHLKAMEALGADVRLEGGYVIAEAKKLKGAKVYLAGPAGPSRGATANLMTAACLAEGTTVIEEAAREPETVDLADLLIAMGAEIEGAGTNEITINGVKNLKPVEYEPMSDQIEAGTLLVCGVASGGSVRVGGADVEYLTPFLECLYEMGIEISSDNDSITAESSGRARPVVVHSKPYPGFPTDLQPQLMAAAALAEGRSVFVEGIYPDRFNQVPELVRLGADIRVEGNTAIVDGVKNYAGATVMASDIRAGAALVIAGLAAEGETHVRRIYHIDRGYEDLEGKLRSLGAEIERIAE